MNSVIAVVWLIWSSILLQLIDTITPLLHVLLIISSDLVVVYSSMFSILALFHEGYCFLFSMAAVQLELLFLV